MPAATPAIGLAICVPPATVRLPLVAPSCSLPEMVVRPALLTVNVLVPPLGVLAVPAWVSESVPVPVKVMLLTPAMVTKPSLSVNGLASVTAALD